MLACARRCWASCGMLALVTLTTPLGSLTTTTLGTEAAEVILWRSTGTAEPSRDSDCAAEMPLPDAEYTVSARSTTRTCSLAAGLDSTDVLHDRSGCAPSSQLSWHSSIRLSLMTCCNRARSGADD